MANNGPNAARFPGGSQRVRLPELEHPIKRQINRLTGGQIRSLDVEVIGNQIIVSGYASCFYHKQLALRGVQEAIGDAFGIKIEINIHVVHVPAS
jgi:hypothetical protein